MSIAIPSYGILDVMHPNQIPWHVIVLGLLKILKAFGLIPGIGAAYWLRRFYQKWRQTRASEGWPSVDATILSAETHGEGKRNFVAEVTYSYFVDEYRTGKYLRHFRKDEDAFEFARQIRDKRIHIHYDPRKPDRSVILDRDIELVVLLVPQLR
jgi:Protein of unknown function (DUF3592)